MPLDFLISALVTLLVVVDPIGLVPSYLAVTGGLPRRARRSVALRAAMIDTTSVDGPLKDLSALAASGKVCGFSAITSVATAPICFGDGLRRMPFVASAPISSEGFGSITATRLASRPRASHPDSIAPPIFPAPARTMVPLMLCNAFVVFEAVTANYSRRPCERRDP